MRRIAAAALPLLLCLAAAPSVARAQQDPQQTLLESRRRLERIRRERSELREEMEGLHSRVHDLSSELANLDRQVTNSAQLLRELDLQVEMREAEVDETKAELAATQERLAHRKVVLRRRLRDIYEHGAMHTAEVLLSAHSFGELLNRYKYLYLIARYDRELVQDVSRLGDELVERQRLLEHNLQELQQAQAERAAEHSLLSGLEAEQRRTLSTTQLRQRSAERRVAQLENDERELGDLVATLERARRTAERKAPSAMPRTSVPAPLGLGASARGSVAWPVDGRVVYSFGSETQPNGSVLRWNGVGIGAPAGTPVTAVEAGEVVLSGPFESYGPTVVISHGGGYYSLYLYLRSATVKKGDHVQRGARIGSVGGERTPEGAHIEFQIRGPTGQPVDPLTWLRPRAR